MQRPADCATGSRAPRAARLMTTFRRGATACMPSDGPSIPGHGVFLCETAARGVRWNRVTWPMGRLLYGTEVRARVWAAHGYSYSRAPGTRYSTSAMCKEAHTAVYTTCVARDVWFLNVYLWYTNHRCGEFLPIPIPIFAAWRMRDRVRDAGARAAAREAGRGVRLSGRAITPRITRKNCSLHF